MYNVNKITLTEDVKQYVRDVNDANDVHRYNNDNDKRPQQFSSS